MKDFYNCLKETCKCQLSKSFPMRKGVTNMNYESIAELVHDLVKNSKSMLSRELGLPSEELKTNEFTIIQRVFSDYKVSGDVLTIGALPLGYWA